MGDVSVANKRDPEAGALEGLDSQELLALYKETGDESVKWCIALRCEGLIKSLALQLRGVYSSFAQMDDIINDCLLTVFDAIDRYGLDRECMFETYVSKRIRGKIIDLARQQEWFPRYFYRRSKEVDKAVEELTGKLGRSPTEDEVIQFLGITKTQYSNYVECMARTRVLQLNDLLDKELVGNGLMVQNSSVQDQPELACQERELREVLAKGIGLLRENERLVLSLYYEKNLKLREIGQVMDLSQPRISQIHARAIQKLRDYMMAYLNGDDQSKC